MLEIAAIASYVAAAAVLAAGMHFDRPGLRGNSLWLAAAGVGLHGWTLGREFGTSGGISADFFSALSMVSLLIAGVLLLAVMRYRVRELLVLALPGAAAMMLLKLLIGPEPKALYTGSMMLDVHVLTSLVSYSLLSIAALTALFIAANHRLLHRRSSMALTDILPPLVTTETLLFQLITTGWLCLTISLASGLWFVDDLFAQHLAHKTVLSILAWVVFGLLLAGRWRYGWRGMRAVRLTLLGMAILLLAYFGSKAVLELLLDRRWQA